MEHARAQSIYTSKQLPLRNATKEEIKKRCHQNANIATVLSLSSKLFAQTLIATAWNGSVILRKSASARVAAKSRKSLLTRSNKTSGSNRTEYARGDSQAFSIPMNCLP